MQDEHSQQSSTSGPSATWLALGFLLAGLGTALLGPILPFVAQQWHLTDAQSGTLFLTKFTGAFLGGMAVAPRLRSSLLAGMILSAVGFAGFALAPNQTLGAGALLLGGFGLGQIIASTNILAGQRYTQHTGAALATLNFFWSLGAVITGVLAGALVPRFGLRTPLLVFAGLFLLCGLGDGFSSSSHAAESANASPASLSKLPMRSFIAFAALLFLYGGLETCLTSWTTTFALRFSSAKLLDGQSSVVLFWVALTAGRGLASLLLRHVRELTAQSIGLAIAAVLTTAMAISHGAAAISAECILLGLALAPFFPATFALLMHHRPPARTAGFILAVSGLGAALFPWLMGIVSSHTGSLRVAMAVPATLAIVLLVVGRLPAAGDVSTDSTR